MKPFSISLTIDFPALSALVAFLSDSHQQKIDAMAAVVKDLTAALKTGSVGLQDAVDKAP